MNICTCIIFFKFFFVFLCIDESFMVDSLTFLFDGRLGRLVTTISFPSTPSQHHHQRTTQKFIHEVEHLQCKLSRFIENNLLINDFTDKDYDLNKKLVSKSLLQLGWSSTASTK